MHTQMNDGGILHIWLKDAGERGGVKKGRKKKSWAQNLHVNEPRKRSNDGKAGILMEIFNFHVYAWREKKKIFKCR